MKINKIFLPIVACTFALGSCDDNKMEWGQPEGQEDVTIADIPLELQEKIANYQSIKAYAQQYTPNMTIGLGIGADYYMNSETVKALSDENFQMYTLGNAMKHSSVVQNNGNLNFGTIDAFLAAIPSDMKVYGHNFIWHTQQKQNYLKNLIAPEMKVETSADDVCENVVTNAGFEEGTTGWTGLWGKYSYEIVQPGHDSDNAIHFTISDECVNNYDAQLFWPLGYFLEPGVTYAYSFWVKSDCGLAVQVIGQNASYGGIYKDQFTPGTDWTLCQGEFTYNEGDTENIERMGIQFGGEPGSQLWVDDFKFGKKIENKDPMTNIVTNYSFEAGTEGWTGLWGKYTYEIIQPGRDSDNAIHFTISDECVNNYDAQLFWAMNTFLEAGKTYAYSFWVKSDCGLAVQVIGQNASYGGIYKDQFTPGTDWTLCEGEFTYNEGDTPDIERIGIQFGGEPGSQLWVDDFKFGEKIEQPAARVASRAAMTYIYKTPEEKRELLLGAMESWIKGMAEHVGNRVMEWDVINEPIADGSNGWRGIDNVFGGSDGDGNQDLEPVEENGLNLNWASDHFYWGYYLGMEYATKAFEYARQYCAPGSKLYVNDYNLETSPKKLESLINFIKYIDENNTTGAPIVDGIGTQMHVVSNITRAEVDAMFKTMAATGKLIRVTELDVRIGYEATANPSAEQLQTQAEVYRMIIESYKANVPEAQQSGITIWGLSDHPDEHTYWYTGDTPNIFDANYARKHAYKGVCDGIAGKDISEEFNGEDWGAAYE